MAITINRRLRTTTPSHSRRVLFISLSFIGVLLFASSKLSFSALISRHEEDSDSGDIRALRSVRAGGEKGGPGIMANLYLKGLNETAFDIPGKEPNEIPNEIPHNNKTSTELMTEVKVDHDNPPSLSMAMLEIQRTSISGPPLTEVEAGHSSPSSNMTVVTLPGTTTRSSKAAEAVKPSNNSNSLEQGDVKNTIRVSQVEFLPSTPSPAEAADVLWALIVHFTGHHNRFKMVTSTWFKRTHPRMGIIMFTGEKNRALVNSSGIPTVFYQQNDSMTDRTLQAMRAALLMFPNAVYITKSDDDAYVYTHRLANTLFSNIPFNYQGQKCASQNETLKLGTDFVYACGGGGYTLTRYATEKLVTLSNPPQHIDIEDVGVGLRLKYALGSEFGLHAVDMHWNNLWAARKEQPEKGPPLSYHYITASVMKTMHEVSYQWRPTAPRSPVPRIFHHLENETIHHTCREINPKWTVMTWTADKIKGLSRRSQKDSAFVQYDVLLRHGGIYLRSNDTCKQPLDARLDQVAEDFEHDGYYLAYDFYEHGFRSGLFVMRPLSDASLTLYHAAEINLNSHPLDRLKSSRINLAILPTTGLFERI